MEDTMSGSDCSSGCESGWTLYLEQSFLSPSPRGTNANFLDQRDGFSKGNRGYVDDEEEEDLSMVSDASSGPPHFQEEEDYTSSGCFYHQEQATIDPTLFTKKAKRQKSKENRRRKAAQDLPSFLDDTASSPFFNFSNNNLALANNQASVESMVDFSQGYSTTHFQGKPSFQEHFGFFHPLSLGHNCNKTNGLKKREWG